MKKLIPLIFILLSCQKKDCNCGKVLDFGYEPKDTSYTLEVKNYCSDSIEFIKVSRDSFRVWNRIRRERNTHRGFNLFMVDEYCR